MRLLLCAFGVVAIVVGAGAVRDRAAQIPQHTGSSQRSTSGTRSSSSTRSTVATTVASTRPPTTRAAPPFDPARGQFGLFPIADKPDLLLGATDPSVKYLQGVMHYKAGQTEVEVDGIFGPATQAGVINVQMFLQLPATGVVDAATWDAIDFLVAQP